MRIGLRVPPLALSGGLRDPRSKAPSFFQAQTVGRFIAFPNAGNDRSFAIAVAQLRALFIWLAAECHFAVGSLDGFPPIHVRCFADLADHCSFAYAITAQVVITAPLKIYRFGLMCCLTKEDTQRKVDWSSRSPHCR